MSRALATGKRTALDRYKAWLIAVTGACGEESERYGCVNLRFYVWLFADQEHVNALLHILLVFKCIYVPVRMHFKN